MNIKDKLYILLVLIGWHCLLVGTAYSQTTGDWGTDYAPAETTIPDTSILRFQTQPFAAGADKVVTWGNVKANSMTSVDLEFLKAKSVALNLLLISGGAVTADQSWSAIDPEGGGPTDDLDTINGGQEGDLLILKADTGDTITVRNGVGNISMSGNVTLTGDATLFLIYDGTNWVPVNGEATGGGGGGNELGSSLSSTTDDIASIANINLNAGPSGNVIVQLGDAAGTNKLSIEDSGSVEVASINSDGEMTVDDVTTPSLAINGATSGSVTLAVPAVAGSSTITIPAATDTLVTRTGLETLTNKTLTSPVIAEISNGGALTLPTGPATLATTDEVDTTQVGTHASPSVANPLAPTWDGPTELIWYGATGEIDLPAASGYAGRGCIIYNTGAFTITVDPNASEVVVRDGTVQTGGVSFTLDSGAGNFVELVSDGARWVTLGYKGTLAEGS